MLFSSLSFLAVLFVHALDLRPHAVDHELLLVPQSFAFFKTCHQQVVVPLKVGQLLQPHEGPLQVKLQLSLLLLQIPNLERLLLVALRLGFQLRL